MGDVIVAGLINGGYCFQCDQRRSAVTQVEGQERKRENDMKICVHTESNFRKKMQNQNDLRWREMTSDGL